MAEEETAGPVIPGDRVKELARSILDQPGQVAPEAAEAAISAAEESGDVAGAAAVLNALAYAAREMLRHDQAQSYADRALVLARRAGLVEEQARALLAQAMIALELGDWPTARALLDHARGLGRLESSLALAGAVLAEKAGDLPTAVALVEDLLAGEIPDPVVRVKALNNLAVYVMESEPERALGLLREALALVPAGMTMFGPLIELNIGLAQAFSGSVPEAIAAIEASGERMRAATGAALSAEWHLEVARVFGHLRLLDEARAAAGRAVAALATDGGALMRPDALVSAARLAVADGDAVTARSMLTDALEAYAAQDRPAGVAIASLELLHIGSGDGGSGDVGRGEVARGEVARGEMTRGGLHRGGHGEIARHATTLTSLGLVRDAAQAWLRAADAAASAGDVSAARSFWARARELPKADPVVALEADAHLAAAGGDPSTARTHIDAALSLIDGRAALAAAADLRQRLAAERLRFEQMDRTLARTEPASARLDGLLRRRPPAPPHSGGGPGDRHDDLRLEWRELARRVESAEESPASLVLLGTRLAETERRLRGAQWSVGGRGGGRSAYGLEGVAAAVGMPILTLARVGTDAVGFVHADGSTESADLGSWADLLAHGAALTRALTRLATGADRSAWGPARDLAGDLDQRLAPLTALVPTRVEILVLLDRGLESLPLQAVPRLWTRPMTVGSLALTGAARPDDPPAPAQVVVAVGPRLTHADAEAEAVTTVWDGSIPARSAGALRTAMGTATHVHVAAHATLRWDNPLHSVIHLDDGPVSLTEIVAAARGRGEGARGIRLLYLAACSLASAPTDPALVGAVPTLAQSGIETVVAASIPLPDEHGPWIAQEVHRAVCRGLTPAAGLAAARTRVDPADPAQATGWAALACLGAYDAAP